MSSKCAQSNDWNGPKEKQLMVALMLTPILSSMNLLLATNRFVTEPGRERSCALGKTGVCMCMRVNVW